MIERCDICRGIILENEPRVNIVYLPHVLATKQEVHYVICERCAEKLYQLISQKRIR